MEAKMFEEDKVIYTPYESLPNPNLTDPSPQYSNALALLKTELWKNNYEGLEQLRILNKYNFPFLCTKLDELDPFIKLHLDSLRSGVLKMTLLFIQELAGSGADPSEAAARSDALRSYLPKLIPALFVKLLDSKKFIVKEVETCLTKVVTFSCSPEVVISLCEQCFTGIAKGTTWSDNVIAYLEAAINAKASLELLEKIKLHLMRTLVDALGTTRKAMIRKVESILGTLKKTCGPEALVNAIKTSGLSEAEQVKLQAAMAVKGEEKKKPEGGLKAYIQSMKHQQKDKP